MLVQFIFIVEQVSILIKLYAWICVCHKEPKIAYTAQNN